MSLGLLPGLARFLTPFIALGLEGVISDCAGREVGWSPASNATCVLASPLVIPLASLILLINVLKYLVM